MSVVLRNKFYLISLYWNVNTLRPTVSWEAEVTDFSLSKLPTLSSKDVEENFFEIKLYKWYKTPFYTNPSIQTQTAAKSFF
jgi:hypothetical protein